jgi:hypothetical protein
MWECGKEEQPMNHKRHIPTIVYILAALALWFAWLVANGTLIVRVVAVP